MMTKNYFPQLDLEQFWDDDELALEEYVDEAPDDLLIASIENELGYKLPDSYIALMKQHNGGIPYATCYPLPEEDEQDDSDYVEITGFLNIGRKKMTLCAVLPATNYLKKSGIILITAFISAIALQQDLT